MAGSAGDVSQNRYYNPRTGHLDPPGLGRDPNTLPFLDNPNGWSGMGNAPSSNMRRMKVPNPAYNTRGGGGSFGNSSFYPPTPTGGGQSNWINDFAGNNKGGGGNQLGPTDLNSFGDIFSMGGNQTFDNNQPQDFNPYQFMPSFQNFQRPDSPVAAMTPEEEFLRQYGMGLLTGEQEGKDTAFDQLLSTVRGDYLSPDSNPFLSQQINALGDISSEALDRNINNILSRAGTEGALGGSRSALMQGEAAGETTRGFNQQVADLLSGNYQRERGNQLSAIPGLLNTEGMDFENAMKAMQLAGMPREQAQKLIDAQMAEWQRMQSERYLPLQLAQSVLGQRMGQTIPIVQPQQSMFSGLGDLFSGAGTAAGGLANLGRGIGNFWGGNANPFGSQAADVGWSGYGAEPDWTSGFDAFDAGGF